MDSSTISTSSVKCKMQKLNKYFCHKNFISNEFQKFRKFRSLRRGEKLVRKQFLAAKNLVLYLWESDSRRNQSLKFVRKLHLKFETF